MYLKPHLHRYLRGHCTGSLVYLNVHCHVCILMYSTMRKITCARPCLCKECHVLFVCTDDVYISICLYRPCVHLSLPYYVYISM